VNAGFSTVATRCTVDDVTGMCRTQSFIPAEYFGAGDEAVNEAELWYDLVTGPVGWQSGGIIRMHSREPVGIRALTSPTVKALQLFIVPNRQRLKRWRCV
jgi:hypothetical protein